VKEYLQLTEDERKDLENNFLREPDAFYEKAETDQLKEALKLSYTDRFLTMTRLMKMGFMLSKAKITHNNSPLSKPE
jgi:hypothetical protein